MAKAVNLGAFSFVNPYSSATVIKLVRIKFTHVGISSRFTSRIMLSSANSDLSGNNTLMRLYQRSSLHNPLIYPAHNAVGIGMKKLEPKPAARRIDAFKIHAKSGISLSFQGIDNIIQQVFVYTPAPVFRHTIKFYLHQFSFQRHRQRA